MGSGCWLNVAAMVRVDRGCLQEGAGIVGVNELLLSRGWTREGLISEG